MKKILSLSILLLLLTTISSCDRETDPNVASDPELLLSNNNCANCSYNNAFTMLHGPFAPADWAPFVNDRLQQFKEQLPANAICTSPLASEVVSQTICYHHNLSYDYKCGNSMTCGARGLMQTSHPSSPVSTGPAQYERWIATDVAYYHDPNAYCEHPINCPSPVPNVLDVTYKKYRCDLYIESNHDLEMVKLDFVGGGKITGGVVTGEGDVRIRFRRKNGAAVPPVSKLEIIAPDGSVYQNITPSAPGADDVQSVDFRLEEHSLMAVKLRFQFN